MRKKNLFKFCKLPMDLQIFAEGGDGAGAGDGNGGGAGGSGGGSGDGGKGTGEGGKNNEPPKNFDDILKNKEHQAEFDRRVQQAINTAVSNAQSKWQLMMDDKLSEAEKLSKMNEEEKQQYLRQRRERELADREAAITKRELMAEAKNTLAEKGLPAALAEMLNYKDADSCKASIEALDKGFKEAVDKAVEERLKGGKPPKRAGSNGGDEGGVAAFVNIIKENQSKR